ncbi:site-specific DNA-methyltransferase [Pseudoduganella aquatica]|uniref:site-specific DNA-methyltransferase (adenine-specific) n=1 Tax=Pseudoduganella aquatica TaxID=2660641 RepID=A0A7X4KPE7_9BURK|nr:site-specific DNA-methyltransferase [Pseudoduganella aquatica]MYN09835.1 site-specific DNA-methyltransferase [Pseudoduganella aquatica]
MEKLKMHSPNLTQDNVARIRDLFPGCVTETKGANGNVRLAVDFDQLRQELSESITEGPQERYQLSWPGKREALLTANAPIAKTLRPCRSESVDFDATNNIFIEGDNLEALKLLQETYLGKVRMIYIDPPYNTGKDFVYEDDFSESADDFLVRSNQKDEAGNRLTVNTEASGRFHSDWMSMLYPRLRLAKNLLSDDGVIFISIDDGEQANLKKICDEVFGESCFIANAVWRSKDNSNNDAKRFSIDHNHTLIYAKNPNWQPHKLSDDSKRGHFKNPDNDPRGAYFDGNPLNSPNYRENLIYDLISPSGNVISPPKNGWRWSKEAMQERIASGEIRFTSDERSIRRRTYLADMEGLPPSTLWIDLEKTGHNRQAKYELIKLIPEDVFPTPKPVKLIKYMMDLVQPGNGDIVMDFFAGSATTADAAISYSIETGKSVRFILVQLPEPCDEKSDAMKAGYRNIAEISKERIRRSGKALLKEASGGLIKKDVGFRVLKIDTSNMADIYYVPDGFDKANLDLFVDNIKNDRTADDLLFQVMLDWGVDLALPISQQTIQGKEVFFVDGNALVACFDAHSGIDESFVKELAKHQPLRVVFRDAGFKDSAVKINVEQIFKLLSPSTEVKCI